jgi:MFS family permease
MLAESHPEGGAMSRFSLLAAAIMKPLQLFSLLRYRDYRLYWIGLVSQVTGQQMMIVTVGWLAYDLTGSPLTLGIVNLLQAVPRISMSLLGGVLADKLDPRRLIILAQIASALLIAGLGVLAFTDLIEVWHLAVGAFFIGLAHAFDEPSRQSLYPHLLPDRSYILKAVPLNSIAWQASRVVAPSIAGFVIAAAGADASLLLSAMGAAVMATMARMLHVGRIERSSRGSMLQNLAEGAHYTWSQRVFRMVVSMAFTAALFAMGYQLMMPVFAESVFAVGPQGLGLMLAASGIGSIFAIFTVSRLVNRFVPGKVILTASSAYALLLVAFAFSPAFVPALAILVLVGYCQVVYLIGGQMVLQTLVPDQLRGRVMGLYGMLWSIMPLGGALLNSIASLTGPRYALAGGAVVLLLFISLVGLRSLELRSARLWTSDAQHQAAGGPVAESGAKGAAHSR